MSSKPVKFTLVELLVVIAIISILAGMLLPALQRARGAARDINCVSNVKQMMLGLIQYTDDNQGYVPIYSGWTAAAPQRSWLGHIAPYLGVTLGVPVDSNNDGWLPDTGGGIRVPASKAMVCPSLDDLATTRGGIWQKNYGLNFYMGWYNSADAAKSPPAPNNTRLTRVRKPSHRYLIADNTRTDGLPILEKRDGNNVDFRHVNKIGAVFGFGDGHAANLRLPEVAQYDYDYEWGRYITY